MLEEHVRVIGAFTLRSPADNSVRPEQTSLRRDSALERLSFFSLTSGTHSLPRLGSPIRNYADGKNDSIGILPAQLALIVPCQYAAHRSFDLGDQGREILERIDQGAGVQYAGRAQLHVVLFGSQEPPRRSLTSQALECYVGRTRSEHTAGYGYRTHQSSSPSMGIDGCSKHGPLTLHFFARGASAFRHTRSGSWPPSSPVLMLLMVSWICLIVSSSRSM